MAYADNPRTQEREAGRLGVKVILSYTATSRQALEPKQQKASKLVQHPALPCGVTALTPRPGLLSPMAECGQDNVLCMIDIP